MSPLAIDPVELKARLQADAAPLVLDVREAEEWAFCRIAGASWIPLAELPRRLDELPRDRSIVCLCHHGGRSAKAQQLLTRAGFTEVYSLTGGIHSWSLKVNPALPIY